MFRIAVLFHKNAIRHNPAGNAIHKLSDTWRDRGDEVTSMFGPQAHMSADVAILHVDPSVDPEPYMEFAPQASVVLNGELRDVRKTRISQSLVKPGDGWLGPGLSASAAIQPPAPSTT